MARLTDGRRSLTPSPLTTTTATSSATGTTGAAGTLPDATFHMGTRPVAASGALQDLSPSDAATRAATEIRPYDPDRLATRREAAKEFGRARFELELHCRAVATSSAPTQILRPTGVLISEMVTQLGLYHGTFDVPPQPFEPSSTLELPRAAYFIERLLRPPFDLKTLSARQLRDAVVLFVALGAYLPRAIEDELNLCFEGAPAARDFVSSSAYAIGSLLRAASDHGDTVAKHVVSKADDAGYRWERADMDLASGILDPALQELAHETRGMLNVALKRALSRGDLPFDNMSMASLEGLHTALDQLDCIADRTHIEARLERFRVLGEQAIQEVGQELNVLLHVLCVELVMNRGATVQRLAPFAAVRDRLVGDARGESRRMLEIHFNETIDRYIDDWENAREPSPDGGELRHVEPDTSSAEYQRVRGIVRELLAADEQPPLPRMAPSRARRSPAR